MQPTTVLAAILLPLIGEMLSSRVAATFENNGDNRDLFWANLMARPQTNSFLQRQWIREPAASPYTSKVIENEDVVRHSYQPINSNSRQLYTNNYRPYTAQSSLSPSGQKETSGKEAPSPSFDAIAYGTPSAEKISALQYIGDEVSGFGHKRANLLKLANQAARGFGRK